MTRLTAREFWPKYRDEVRKRCSKESMTDNWHSLGIKAAEVVIRPLEISRELTLDILGYERRTANEWFNSDLRVAFEHEVDHPYPYHDDGTGWRCELWKLAHIAADLRVLVGYYKSWDGFLCQLNDEIILMDDRMYRVPNSEWLFVFGAIDSNRERQPWRAWTINGDRTLIQLDDENPFCPIEYCENGKM